MKREELDIYLDTPQKRKLYALISERPQQASAFKQLAALMRADRQYAAAAAVLMRAARRHPQDHTIAMHLAQTRAEAGETGRAAALYGKIIRERPDDPVAYERLERLFKETGRYDLAVKLYQRIPKGSPLKERSHERIHILLVEKMRDFRRGAENLREAISGFGPTHRRCKDLGRLCAKLCEWKEASRYYAMALELKKDDADLVSLLGWALVESGNLEAAEGCFRKIRGTFQGSAGLAELYLRQGRIEEAEAELKALGRLYPGSPRVSVGFADISLRRGDAESARRLCEDALRRIPPYFAFEQARAHETLAEACRRLGDAGAAARHAEFAAALRRGPDTYTALITLAEGKIGAGQLDGAAAALDRILELYPGNTRALVGHGEVQLRRGDPAQAKFFGERALEGANPKYIEELIRCHELLAEVYRMLKDARRAEIHARNAAEFRGSKITSASAPRTSRRG